jgi:acetyl-CoA synthetase
VTRTGPDVSCAGERVRPHRKEYALGVTKISRYWSAADPGWAYGLYTAIVAPLAAGIPSLLAKGNFSALST